MKHLTRLMDLTEKEIHDILNTADQLKYEVQHDIPHPRLQGKTLGMIFEKVSTRTRVSFEAGMYQLGGHALFLSSRDLQMFRGEPVEDTARTLARYVNGLVIRTFDQKEVDDFARYAGIPVINGMTDAAHPGQVLAGLRTVVACPEGYDPPQEILDFAAGYGSRFLLTRDPIEAAEGADDVQTDVWVSSGMEAQTDRRRCDFAGYTVTDEVMAAAKADAILQHPLPACRGEEVSGEMFERHAAEIFDEAENRLHVQKAVLVKLLGREPASV